MRAKGVVDFLYDAHGHGAVIKDDGSGNIIVGGNQSSPVDRASRDEKQPLVVLGYDVKDQPNRVSQSDLSNAANNQGSFVPLSNPRSFNQTISFYRKAGELTARAMNYNNFKTAVEKIRGHTR